ncbi:MAG: DNA polymerase III subunit alpha [Ignavibacteriae bacterium]|nr:DNA polymerase III subunit alpha [Ignavibacteriota bacterium]
MSEFIHLHNHSHFSLLDGAATIDGLIEAAVENKMPSVALTDHGVMFGAIEFYKTAKKAGIKPIIGCEVYIVTQGSRFDKEVNPKLLQEGKGRGIYQHLVLLAKNFQGYKNLSKLCTLGHTEGFYYKPRIDMELLRQYSEGLVALSACPAGVVSFHLVEGRYEAARSMAITFKELFGDDFYLEIQDHSLAKEKPILEGMPRLAKELNIKLIATNDVHYLEQSHAIAHNVLLMIPDASANAPAKYHDLRYGTDQIYFKTPKQMCELFKDYPQAIESTLEVAEKIENYKLEPGKPFMPNFPIPPDAGVASLEEYLDHLAQDGIQKRYKSITGEIEERLNFELKMIKKMGYAGYFLITQDFINKAKNMGVRVGPGRGSAAGSIVSYALGITDVDPLKYDLLFERFLNPDRVSMPDIDVDFADDGRDRVIEYVREKYGADSVSQIITFGTLSSRAVLKDVGRVIGVPLSMTESITKQIPVIQGKVTPIAEAIDTLPDLKWIKETDDEKIHELVEISKVLEGMNRNSSTHAAGVVIAPGPISDYVPLYKTPSTDLMTQYSMLDLEAAGLLKMDFLGLRTLTIIENALKLIKQNHQVEVDLNNLPENDPKVFELFGKAHTIGIFQFESSGMQDWLRKLKPNSISDLVAMNALYRPGPMEMIGDFIERKHGRQHVAYLHPKLEPILKETYGVIVYQEQVIKIASEVAGFTLAKADILRRAMGKKDEGMMAKMKQEFIDGAIKQGVKNTVAGEIFELIRKFASYGFNKSHSVAYSIVAYQTAYLKAHYPAEFLCACMSAEIGDSDTVVQLIEESKKLGIEVLPPDVNESDVQFLVVQNKIRFGLNAIKNVGENAVRSIIHSRATHGKFNNLFDFSRRVDLRIVNKKTFESLIQAGACDSFGGHRAQLFQAIERVTQFGQQSHGHKSKGQDSLFEGGSKSKTVESFPVLPETQPWSENEKLTREKSVLGFYVSGHPLSKYNREIKAFATAKMGEPAGVKPGSPIRVCGILSDVKKKVDKKGNMMAFAKIEDFTGKGECIFFSSVYKDCQEHVKEDAIVMVVGKADDGGDVLKIIANELIPIDFVRSRFTRRLLIQLKMEKLNEQKVKQLKSVFSSHRGKCSCYFQVTDDNSAKPINLVSKKVAIDPNNEFFHSVETLIGAENVMILN